MTMPCETVQEMLTPLLDQELGQEERVAMEAHLASCSLCQEERTHIMEVTKATGEAFRGLLVQAPPYPETMLNASLAEKPIWKRALPVKSLLAAAAVILAIVTIVFTPRHEKPLSAAELLQKATRALAAHDDAEIQVTFKTPFFNALLGDPKEKPDIPRYRILVTRNNQLLIVPLGDRREQDATSGYDGKTFWQYDPTANAVTLTSGKKLAETESARTKDGGLVAKDGSFNPRMLLEFLSWDRFTRLDEDFDWREIRAGIDGRRIFESKVVPTDPEHPDVLMKNALVTLTLAIDPQEGLVESVHIVYRYFGADVLAMEFDLLALDRHPAPEVFSYATHAPKDAKVVHESGESDDTDEKK